MRIIKPSFEIVSVVNGDKILMNIESAGRTCYRSEDAITPHSARLFVKSLIDMGHHSVLEHESISVRIICDRGILAEITRHRLVSYSVESTRYCSYGKEKFGKEITVIDPRPYISGIAFEIWKEEMIDAEDAYFSLLKNDTAPQMARSVLPNSLKTELVMTCNLREWRHFFTLRTSRKAHPQMRQIACPMLAKFRKLVPIMFDDVGETK